MKKVFTFIVFLISYSAVAQQQIQVSQYMLNQYLVNPAVAGTSDFFEATTGYRMQWVGLEGAPRTFYLTAHGPIGKAPDHYNWRKKKKYHHGVGLQVGSDKTGLLSRSFVYGTYSYVMPITKKIRVSTGLSLGVQQHMINGAGVDMKTYDASLPGVDISKIVPDVSLGSWLYSKDFYVGISANQMLRNRLDYSVNNPLAQGVGRLRYHYFLTGGVRIPFYFDEMEWIPSIMLRAVSPAPLSFDLNSKIRYKKMYWAGVSYRHFDAIAILAGITLAKSLSIGYSYDAGISKLAPYHYNSHEIVINYSFRRLYEVWSPQMFW